MGDGHVASAASVVTWRDACIARATQRPFPVDVGVTSARCGGGATPKLAFFMRREPQEHPFGGDLPFWATFAYLPVGFVGEGDDERDDEAPLAGNFNPCFNRRMLRSCVWIRPSQPSPPR